jgi:uncharacterized protein YfaS (alpha-2-macroglobulin family)
MKLMRFTKKRAVAFGLAFGLAAGAGGIAAAYFTASGTGTGSATVGKPVAFTVTQTSPAPTVLYPGSTSTVTFNVHNTAGFSQHFTTATATLTLSGIPSGCTASWFSNGTPSPTSGTVAGGGNATVTVTITFATVTATQNKCATYTPTVKLHV